MDYMDSEEFRELLFVISESCLSVHSITRCYRYQAINIEKEQEISTNKKLKLLSILNKRISDVLKYPPFALKREKYICITIVNQIHRFFNYLEISNLELSTFNIKEGDIEYFNNDLKEINNILNFIINSIE